MAPSPSNKKLLLLLLLLAASAVTGRCSAITTDDDVADCPSTIYDHTVSSKGGIEFPVFHRNHICLRSAREMNNKMGITVDVIEDSDINAFLFLMPIMLGTPPVLNLVGFDTGSTLSWVQCQPCTLKCHDQSPKAGQIFDPSKSTTFRPVGCSSSDCLRVNNSLGIPFANCMEKENSCLYSMTYGGGWTSTVGKVVRGKLLIGRDSVLILELMFGCSLESDYPESEAGIIGFGTSSFSFFEQVSSRISYKAFSCCLPSDETRKGYMILGDYDREGVDGYTPLLLSSNRPAYALAMDRLVANGESLVTSSSEIIVDSGSWWTVLSPYTFGRIDEVMTRAVASLGYLRSPDRGDNYICFILRDDTLNWGGPHTPFSSWSSLPTVEFGFTGTASLTVPPEHLFHNHRKYGLCMNFFRGGHLIPQVLGNRMTLSVEIAFDIQGGQFGFRNAAC